MCRNSTGSTLNTILMLVGDFSMMLTGEWDDEDDFGRNDLDARGLMGESILLLLPLVRGWVVLSMSMASLVAVPSMCREFDRLELVSLSRVLFLSKVASSTSASAEDVFLFRRRREPSIGSSGAINWLKTECESGLIAPR